MKFLIDKNYRLFGIPNIISIIIILIVSVFIAIRFSAPLSIVTNAAKSEGVTIRYTVELQRKNPDFKKNIKVGVKVKNSGGNEIGTITNVYSEPYLEDAPDYDNNIIRRSPIDGFETVYIEIEANAQVTDYTTLIGSYEVLIGKQAYISTIDFEAVGYIVGLNRGNAA